jgi:hypothetical protein
MKTTTTNIFKNGIWLTFPPLLFSLSLMGLLPDALTPAQFNKDIPDLLVMGENIARVFVFGMPLFFSVSLSTKTQKRGLLLYLVAIALYYLSYLVLIFMPNTAWSNSLIGFAAPAYINIFWMSGLGLLGEKFYFPDSLRYRPRFYIAPAIIFLTFHIAHTVIVYQRHF